MQKLQVLIYGAVEMKCFIMTSLLKQTLFLVDHRCYSVVSVPANGVMCTYCVLGFSLTIVPIIGVMV